MLDALFGERVSAHDARRPPGRDRAALARAGRAASRRSRGSAAQSAFMVGRDRGHARRRRGRALRVRRAAVGIGDLQMALTDPSVGPEAKAGARRHAAGRQRRAATGEVLQYSMSAPARPPRGLGPRRADRPRRRAARPLHRRGPGRPPAGRRPGAAAGRGALADQRARGPANMVVDPACSAGCRCGSATTWSTRPWPAGSAGPPSPDRLRTNDTRRAPRTGWDGRGETMTELAISPDEIRAAIERNVAAFAPETAARGGRSRPSRPATGSPASRACTRR